MTVTELLLKLGSAFTLFRASGEVWAPVFRARLERHEGAALQKAFLDTLASFHPGARQPFPLPADFEQHLPHNLPQPTSRAAARLDFKARADRAQALMAEWHREQGERAARGVPEIATALGDIAWPLARRAAWSAHPPALRLTRGQVRLAHQRALSQQRCREQGTPPRDGEAWWAQIDAIAARWSLDTDPDDWRRETLRAPSHPAQEQP